MKLKSSFWVNPQEKYYLLLLLIFGALMFTVENINGRFWLNDFKVMYSAANAYQNGDSIYGIPFGLGSGFYKYSPLTMLFFVPYTVLPYYIAASVHFLLIGLVLFLITRTLFRLIGNHTTQRKQLLLYFFLFLTIIDHLTRELHLGNVNLILIYLILQSLWFWKNGKLLPGAILIALVLITKPYLLLLAIPFVFSGRWKEVSYTAITLIVITAGSFLAFGLSKGQLLYEQWITAIIDHSKDMTSDQTIFSILKKLTGLQTANSMTFILFAIVSCLTTLLFLRKCRKVETSNVYNGLLPIVFIILALMPNFLITDTEHFLFSLPLIYWVYTNFSSYRTFEKCLFVIGAFLYAFHPALSAGTIGIGNLIFVGTAVVGEMKLVKGKDLEKSTSDNLP